MPSLSARSGQRPRILVVEDDQAVRRSLQLLLCGQGFDVRAYGSAIGLAEDPEALRSECLVADLMIPGKNAVELLGELRAAGWNGRSILISGFLDEENAARAHAAGFDIALAKPLADAALNRSVAQLVSPPA